MKNQMNVKGETKYNKFQTIANVYEIILLKSGVTSEELETLIKIYDVSSIIDFDIDLIYDLNKENYIKLAKMFFRGNEYLNDNQNFRSDMFRKSYLYGELENDEIKKLIIGYCTAICCVVVMPLYEKYIR
jgi:hypothetical protein